MRRVVSGELFGNDSSGGDMATRTAPLIPKGTWTVDPVHSSVEFSVKHMGIANVRGKFTEFEGTLEMKEELAVLPSTRLGDRGLDRHRRVAARPAPALTGLLQRRGVSRDHVRVHARGGDRR
jgi:hypothetical protein